MERPDLFKPRMSEEAFNEYLRVCQELHLEMVAEGTWLWRDDSPNSENLLESEDI